MEQNKTGATSRRGCQRERGRLLIDLTAGWRSATRMWKILFLPHTRQRPGAQSCVCAAMLLQSPCQKHHQSRTNASAITSRSPQQLPPASLPAVYLPAGEQRGDISTFLSRQQWWNGFTPCIEFRMLIPHASESRQYAAGMWTFKASEGLT